MLLFAQNSPKTCDYDWITSLSGFDWKPHEVGLAYGINQLPALDGNSTFSSIKTNYGNSQKYSGYYDQVKGDLNTEGWTLSIGFEF